MLLARRLRPLAGGRWRANREGCVAREAFEQRYVGQTSRIFVLDARGKPHYRQLNRASALDADLPQCMRAAWRCALRDRK